jgi:hypothetical protein
MKLWEMFQQNILGITAQGSLPKAEEKCHNIFVGDEVFALHVHNKTVQ